MAYRQDPDEDRMQEAVKTGSKLTILKTMRTMLAERFDGASARDSASLAMRIEDLGEQIENLEGEEIDHDTLDPLQESLSRWTDRMAGSAGIHTPNLCAVLWG